MAKERVNVTTHCNGGRPFRVRVFSDRKVLVSAIDLTGDGQKIEEKPMQFDCKRVWISDGCYPEITEDGDKTFGAACLLQRTTGEYVLVGDNVIQFKLRGGHEVMAFEASVGPNDVPYPYMLTHEGEYLFYYNSGEYGKNLVIVDKDTMPSLFRYDPVLALAEKRIARENMRLLPYRVLVEGSS